MPTEGLTDPPVYTISVPDKVNMNHMIMDRDAVDKAMRKWESRSQQHIIPMERSDTMKEVSQELQAKLDETTMEFIQRKMQVGSLYGKTGIDPKYTGFVFDDEKLLERWQELIDTHPPVKDIPPIVIGDNGKLYLIDSVAASSVGACLHTVRPDYIDEFYNGSAKPVEASGETIHGFVERCIDGISDPYADPENYRKSNTPSFSIRRFGRKKRMKKGGK